MKLTISYFYITFFTLFTMAIFGQVKNIGLPDVRNYKRNEYKGGTQNWNIDQDKNGNLYFANNNGLLQFDGSSWKKYPLPNLTSVRCLKIDNSGKIYVGGYNEFGYFQPDNKGKLKYTSLSKKVDKNKIKIIDFIWKIHSIDNQTVFQSFARAYIFKKGKLSILKAPRRFQFSFVVNNRLYFQDEEKGILEYKNGKLYPLPNTTSLNNTEIWAMYSIGKNKILIITLERGLFIYENNILTQWNTEANNFVKRNNSLGGVLINNKFIVLNSVLDGIAICDFDGKIIQHINRKKGLQNNTVLTSFIDNKNNLWLGLDNGITFVNESSPFTYFGFSYDISTVYASVVHQGNLYVATNQGVFYHAWNNSFKEDVFKLVEGTTAQSWNVQVIDDELICANNRGALIIKGGRVTNIIDSKGYFGFKKIPSHPGFYIGSNYDGFAIFQKTANGLSFKNQVAGFDKSSNSFELDQSYLWLKKDESIYKMSLSEDLTRFSSIKKIDHLTPQFKNIGSIQKIDGKIYFQTNNHFYKYSSEQEIFYEDKKITGLFKNIPVINALSEDSQSNLWYAYDESLGVLMKQNNGYKNIVAPFSNLTGNLVTNYLSVNTIDSKNIFIGLTDGLAHYDSELLNNFVTKPKAFVRSFSFPGDTIILGNNQNKSENIRIPYSSNHVRFTFSSPTYENLENVQFSYQLEPFDEKWSNWSTISIKEYTNLREGDYVMNVKVRNSYGVQSEPSTISFTVSPPWYRHFLAFMFYFIVLIIAIYVISSRIKMKIRKNKYYETIEQRRLYLEKESRIRQEQYDLEKEIEKLKNDKLQIKILAKDKELVNNSLQVVKKNKILNGIIHKLKEIDVEALDDSTKFQVSKLNKSIVKEVNTDKSWKDLEKHIKNVHFEFLKRLKEKYPTISPRELDLSTYLLMNMSTKEIAEIMNISTGGVELARYRLRKKLGLNKKENLIGFLMSI
ncbi:ligand-binding sensor domain-containing protein/DNA-binding CsgD family transcriptional regulator [Flavobacterium sp. 2755]|uniref:triple tyrosine motif-containing protein n=1 Tax=Flavobacterium sp. 2755 TaxID=2817765 RepID=UPI00285982DA|nr:triple tyrosine motif-containing protein [Flavobacterium sp. 2755]MDR6761171.1 ligand-binding sensor domain-containing protein/DNA-binding CsgD family transcriptional regulator [Flavobacterium sp. 2755]